MTNAQDANADLHHAHRNGVPLPELAARSLVPPHTLACIMGRDTIAAPGEPDADVHTMPGLLRLLGGGGE